MAEETIRLFQDRNYKRGFIFYNIFVTVVTFKKE
jgi:hypothetical protein